METLFKEEVALSEFKRRLKKACTISLQWNAHLVLQGSLAVNIALFLTWIDWIASSKNVGPIYFMIEALILIVIFGTSFFIWSQSYKPDMVQISNLERFLKRHNLQRCVQKIQLSDKFLIITVTAIQDSLPYDCIEKMLEYGDMLIIVDMFSRRYIFGLPDDNFRAELRSRVNNYIR